MVGGLAGASVAASGLDGVRWVGMTGVLIALVATPALGLAGGYLYMKLVWGAGSFFTPALNAILRRAQVLTSALVAVSYGTNEAQKGMGLILAALLARSGHQVGVPLWAQLASAIAIAGGVALGGSATLRTLGMRVFRIRPVHGFAAQATSAAIVIASTLLGGPTSMTQVATSAIFGVGAANRVTAVRWELGTSIVLAWLITLPATAVVAGALYWLTRLVA
jgi:PiT family inorganic phosphate transporter